MQDLKGEEGKEKKDSRKSCGGKCMRWDSYAKGGMEQEADKI